MKSSSLLRVTAIALLALGWLLWQQLPWNLWALKWLHYKMNDAPKPSVELAQSQRISLWLAQEALEQGKPQNALELLSDNVATDPLTLQQRGLALQTLGNYEEAIQSYLQAGDSVSLKTLANHLKEIGELDLAQSAYQARLVLEPERGITDLANFLANNRGNKEEAEAVLRKALLQFPTSSLRSRWLLTLGDILRKEQDFDAAVAAYQEFLALHPPDSWRGYIGMGWVYYERDGDVGASVKAFQQAIAANPTSADGYIELGRLYYREKDYATAESWFQQAVDLKPDQSWWWLLLANTQRAQGKDATDTYKEIIRRFPDFAAAYYELAWQYHLSGNETAAAEAIEEAIRLMQQPNVWYYVRAGAIYEAGGETTQALKAYQQALELQPDNTPAQQGVTRLKGAP